MTHVHPQYVNSKKFFLFLKVKVVYHGGKMLTYKMCVKILVTYMWGSAVHSACFRYIHASFQHQNKALEKIIGLTGDVGLRCLIHTINHKCQHNFSFVDEQ